MKEVTRRRGVQVEETMMDRVVAWVDPERAVRRRQARVVLAMTDSYVGASRSRRGMKNYNPSSGSADADINRDLPTLRDRARDLARNNPIGGGAINTTVNNVVGTGLILNARVDRDVLGMTDDEASEFEKTAERGFKVFAAECDLERTNTLYGLQELAFRSTLENGDALALIPFVRRPGEAWGTKVQLVEADRLCNPNSRSDTETLSGGVELDAYGAPVAYTIMSCHPGDIKTGLKREWKRYEAYGSDNRRRVLHLYRKLRIGQHRGVPYLAPVIETILQLGRYTEAEVMAAVVSGMFTVFIQTETGDGINTDDLVAADGREKSDDGDIELGYGAMVNLKNNEKIESANPGRPNAAFDPFVMSVCRQIGMALELPYEVLVKHFTASYSAARAALLEAWTFYRGRRAWLRDSFCQPIYEAWMWEAVARGYLYAPGFTSDPLLRAAYLGAEWIGPQAPQIDPVKVIDAASKRMANRLTTRSEECLAITGTDWETKVPQMRREQELLGGMADAALSGGGEPDPDDGEDEAAPSRPDENDEEEDKDV
jgi:lambda family phage portal protein